MLQDRIAQRYAKALFDLSEEQGQLDSVMRELKELEAIYTDSSEFRLFLKSPVITPVRKVKILTRIFKGKASELIYGYLVLLATRNRVGLLPWIIDEITELYNKLKNIITVEVISIEPLPKNLKQILLTKLETDLQCKVSLKQTTDPDLVGGYKLLIGGSLYDASVEGALRNLQKQIVI